ncbi:MAG: hypothetical protein ACJZ69_01900 [Pelagibacteraceae bacterium]
MSQLTFKFPFKITYYESDFYVSSNNFEVYKLIESWPEWTDKKINIYGPKGCGKTHLANILRKKLNSLIIKSSEIEKTNLDDINKFECLIIDDYNNNIEENFFYSFLNQITQTNKYLVINSQIPIKKTKVKLNDLKSRLDSFIDLGIDLPTDDLLRVIITKSFSDKQIKVNIKLLEFILKNIDRSYEKVFKFIRDIDNESLKLGKPISMKLIKSLLNKK